MTWFFLRFSALRQKNVPMHPYLFMSLTNYDRLMTGTIDTMTNAKDSDILSVHVCTWKCPSSTDPIKFGLFLPAGTLADCQLYIIGVREEIFRS